MSRPTPYKVYESEAYELDQLPRGSYVQEYDGYHNYVHQAGRFVVCIPGSSEGRPAVELDFPVTVLYVPEGPR